MTRLARWLPCALLACLDATAIDVRVSTEVDCALNAPVAIVVGTSLDDLATQLSHANVSAHASGCTTPGSPSFVGDVVLVPKTSRDEPVAFAVMSRKDGASADACGDPAQPQNVLNQCIVAKRSLSFIPHETLSVDVSLQLSCVGIVCASNETCDNGVCVPACKANVQTDPKNCGACGHDCIGGACVSGVCQPQVAFTSANEVPRTIVVDKTYAYFIGAVWNTNNSVIDDLTLYRCNKTACASTTVALNHYAGIGGALATDGSSLYFADATDVLSCALPECKASTVIAANQVGPAHLGFAQGRLFWTDYAVTGDVMSWSIAGSATVIAPNQLNAWGVGTDATNVYWTNDVQAPYGGVYSCPLTGCVNAPTPITTSVAAPSAVVSDGSSVYFTAYPDNTSHVTTAYSCPVSGCVGAPTPLASNLGGSGLAVDASYLYVSGVDASNQPAVVRCAKTGCAADSKVLATNQPSGALFIAVDDVGVYWTTYDGNVGGTVMFLAK